MPGFMIHFACASEDIINSELGRLGLIAPDIWKEKIPTYEEYLKFFSGISGCPSYRQILFLCDFTHNGTHYGRDLKDTGHVNFELIRKDFEAGIYDKTNMFIIGFMQHLRVDFEFYSNYLEKDTSFYEELAEDVKQNNYVMSYVGKEKLRAVNFLHEDWHISNGYINKWYPNVYDMLPDQVRKIVGFTDGKLTYIDSEYLHDFIERMRQLRSLQEILEP